ncbi:hypothetical protein ScPMuIL_001217 [Solemya velum]
MDFNISVDILFANSMLHSKKHATPEMDFVVNDRKQRCSSNLYPNLKELEVNIASLQSGCDINYGSRSEENLLFKSYKEQNCANITDETKLTTRLYPDLTNLLLQNGFLPQNNDISNTKSVETNVNLDNTHEEWISWRTRANQQLSFLILQKAGRDVSISEEESRRKALSDRTVGKILRKSFANGFENSSLSGKSYIMYGIPRVQLSIQ